MSAETLSLLARIHKKGGRLLLATDHVDYSVWMLEVLLTQAFRERGRSVVQAPLLLQDGAFAIAGVDALEAKLKEAKVRYEGHRYLAHHAFANEDAQGRHRIGITQYDAAWAQLAYDRTMRFFGLELG
mgnify:CR=1 FL=1